MVTWKTVVDVATKLPETEVGVWYGKPALTIAGKGFLHLGEGDAPMSFPSPEKDDLLVARSDVYWHTPHHDGSPWLLCDLSKVTEAELREHLRDAWRLKAPPKVRKAHPEV